MSDHRRYQQQEQTRSNSSRSYNNSYKQKDSLQRIQFPLRSLVFFHYSIQKKNQPQPLSFLCKGLIVREPKYNSPVYKIVITDVDINSCLSTNLNNYEVSNVIREQILLKKIVRNNTQISKNMNEFAAKLYSAESNWISLESWKRERILNSLK